MTLNCPVCSSEDCVESDERYQRGLDLGFGVKFSVETWDHICNQCGFQGAFDDTMDRKFNDAHLKAHQQIIAIVSDKLREIGSDTEIELALSLFPRTIRKWRESKDLSHTSTALFKVLAKYPHILDSELRERRKRSAESLARS